METRNPATGLCGFSGVVMFTTMVIRNMGIALFGGVRKMTAALFKQPAAKPGFRHSLS